MLPLERRDTRPPSAVRVGSRKRVSSPKARKRRLDVEPLEDRTLLTVTISGTVFNDLNSNGKRDGNEPGLAGASVFLDRNHDGSLDSQDLTFAPPQIQFVPDPLGFGLPATELQISGLPDQISHARVNLDLDDTGNATILVALVSPLGIQDQAGPNLIFLKPGDHFAGSFDDLAGVSASAASSPFVGSFRPSQALSDPNSHVYDAGPNGLWSLLFISNTGDISGLTIHSWSLTFNVPEFTT